MHINMNVSEKIRNHQSWSKLVEIVKKLSYLKGKDDEFTLASGRKSSHFFDMKPLMMDPEGSILLAELMEIYLDELDRRRGTDWTKIYPQMWELVKDL